MSEGQGIGEITGPGILSGKGSPEGVYTSQMGGLYRRVDGSSGLYIKLSGTGNTGWVILVDLVTGNNAIATAVAPKPGEIVQSTAYGIPSGGPAGSLATVYGFTSSQGAVYANFSFTPKAAGNRLRVWYFLNSYIAGSPLGWHGYALFRDPDANPIAQSWHYTTVANVGATEGSGGIFTQATAVAINFSLRGGVGQSGSTTQLIGAPMSALFIDEIQA